MPGDVAWSRDEEDRDSNIGGEEPERRIVSSEIQSDCSQVAITATAEA